MSNIVKLLETLDINEQGQNQQFEISVNLSNIEGEEQLVRKEELNNYLNAKHISVQQAQALKKALDFPDINVYVTPEQFGAKGDGLTDDSDAFIKALNEKKKVVCDSTKTYYFKNPIDVRTLQSGHLDGNNAHFINFHIYIDMNDDLTDWAHINPDNEPNYGNPAAPTFIIENMNLRAKNYWGQGKPEGWETPLILTGATMRISNITTTYPYILSTPDRYIDYMQLERWNFCYDPDSWKDVELSLNTISCCCPRYLRNTNREKPIFCNFKYEVTDDQYETEEWGTPWSAGDSWRFQQCSEFSIDGHPEYKFMNISRRQPIVIESCIQTSFNVDSGSQVIFQGCHWESKSNVTFEESLGGSTIQFNSCYFYCNHKLNDTPFTTYNQCKFAAGPYLNAFLERGIPLSELTNNKSFYDLKCKLIDCNFGDNYVINTYYMLLSKYLPKKTYNKNCTKERKTLDIYNKPAELLEGLSASTNNYFKEAGTYTYKLYLRTTSQDNVVLNSIEKQYQIDDIENQYRIGLKVPYVNGGCSLYIIRTSPSGTKEYTEFYGNPNTFKDINEDMYYMFYDFGTYNTFTIEKNDWQLKDWLYKTTLQPWITLEKNPEFIFNKQLYEANGALVTLNGETLLFDLNGQAQLFNYINLDEIYFHNFDNNMETTSILGQGKLGFMKLGGK